MRYFALISLISFAIFLYMASSIYNRDRKSPLNRAFCWTCLVMSVWAFSEFMYRQAATFETAYFWIKVRALSWPFSIAFLFSFILVFTEKARPLRRTISYLMIFVPALIISIIDLSTHLLTAEPIMEYWGYTYAKPGSSWVYWMSMGWAVGITLLTILLAFRYFLQVTDEKKKKQVRSIVIGISIPIFCSISTEVLLPFLHIRLPELTNTSGAWLALFVGYAISKYELFLISPATASDNILSTMTDSLILMEPSGKIVAVNRATSALLGWEERELIGQPAKVILGEESSNPPIWEEIVEKGLITNRELTFRLKGGGEIPVIFSGSPIKDQEGNVEGIVSISKDITSRKRVEEVLRESEARYRGIMEQSTDGIYLVDRESKCIIESNPAFAQMLAYEPQETIGLSIYDLIAADRGDIDRQFEGMIDQGESTFLERHMRKKDGSLIEVWIRGKIIDYRGKRVNFSVATDITERNRVEEALRESEERYRTLVKDSRDAIYISTPEGQFLDMNPAGFDLFGYSQEEFANLNARDIYLNPQERLLFIAEMERKGYVRDYEVKFRKKDATIMDCLLSAVLYRDESGKPIQYRGIVRNITDRKRAEEAVQESEARYRAIMKQSAEGIYLVNTESKRIVEANAAFCKMLGYAPEEVLGLSSYDFVAADWADVDQRFHRILDSPAFLSFERKFRRKDGSVIEVWITTSIIYYRGNKVACGLVRDLTERKQAEAEREKLISELQEALANIKTLSGLIPICANCKKIRDDKGYWQGVEKYVHEHSEASFSHGLCPECTKLFFPNYGKKNGGRS